MEFSWVQFLLDNAASGGSRAESHASVHVVIHPSISWPVFNWAIVEPSRNCDADRALDDALSVLSSVGRRLSVAIPEGEHWLESLAEARGLKPGETHHVYWCHAESLPRANFRQPVEVRESRNAHSWLELLMDGFEVPEEGRPGFRSAHSRVFGDPRAHLFEAVCGNQRAGAAILWHDHDIAGLNTAAVKPEWRRRGVHGALFGARINRGISLRARCFATETAEEPVMRVAEKWGFQEGLRYRYWF